MQVTKRNAVGLLSATALGWSAITGARAAFGHDDHGQHRGQTLFRSDPTSGIPGLGLPPAYGDLLPAPTTGAFLPDVYVFDKDFENPRTFNAMVGFERELVRGLFGSISYTHARTDHLTRFVNGNDAVFGKPWGAGLAPGGVNGINNLFVVQARPSPGTTASRPRSAGRSILACSSR